MLTHPNTAHMQGYFTMLEDYVQSSEEICRLLVEHLIYADTLAPEDLPLEVPLLFFGERMHKHPHAVTGLFEYARKINDANEVVIPYGHDPIGVQIVDPVVVPPPVIMPVPAAHANQPPVQGGAPPIAPAARPRSECSVDSRHASSSTSDDASEHAIGPAKRKHDSTAIATSSGHYASQCLATSTLDQSLGQFGY